MKTHYLTKSFIPVASLPSDVIPAPLSVIPAKAGTHFPVSLWIPNERMLTFRCAKQSIPSSGMTVRKDYSEILSGAKP